MTTKAQLQSDNDRLSKDAAVLHLALNDAINGKVQWFRKGKLSLGISRPAEAAGGIVIERYDGYACAYYWEDWWPGVRDNTLAWHQDTEAFSKRELAYKAHDWIVAQQRPVVTTGELVEA